MEMATRTWTLPLLISVFGNYDVFYDGHATKVTSRNDKEPMIYLVSADDITFGPYANVRSFTSNTLNSISSKSAQEDSRPSNQRQ